MSFSLNVPATALDDLPERLDGLHPSPPLESDAAKAAFDTAKAAFEQIAVALAQNDRPVGGSISGHWYEGGETSYPKNSINLSISEVDPPAAATS